MKIHIKKIILIFTGLFITSCSTPSTNTQNEIKAGTKVDAKYLTDFLPDLKQGIKYAYLSIEKKGSLQISNRIEIEVLEVNSNKVKIKTLTSGVNENTIDVDLNEPSILPLTGILYQSRESLSVPAGTYLTSRFSYIQNNSTLNAWLSEDVGIIKILEQKNNGDSVITELNEFRR